MIQRTTLLDSNKKRALQSPEHTRPGFLIHPQHSAKSSSPQQWSEQKGDEAMLKTAEFPARFILSPSKKNENLDPKISTSFVHDKMQMIVPPSVLLREQEEKKITMLASQKSSRKRNNVTSNTMTQAQFLSSGNNHEIQSHSTIQT